MGWSADRALVFRDPALINSFASVSTNPNATGPARLEMGVHQYGLLAGVVASIEYLASLDESARVPDVKGWRTQWNRPAHT
ncbi:cysteine desulfurase domain protein [Mycobacterium xenopi 4042]|uniref:Cysteine desulfurase domain protein n=1 Tax=Mycobacterium xenopi 4042 TaxID=1299334 RepID=X7ZII8_MYCXE|nr:cysteine desulfurase domain protein [Mycobacterium xenopi 4042]